MAEKFITDVEAAAIAGMPPAVATGFLTAKRRDREHGYDDIRTFLDEHALSVNNGDPEQGRLMAEFNDDVIDKLYQDAMENGYG
jgi:hypothetical protein